MTCHSTHSGSGFSAGLLSLTCCLNVGESSILCTGNFGLETLNADEGRKADGLGAELNGRGEELLVGSSIEAVRFEKEIFS